MLKNEFPSWTLESSCRQKGFFSTCNPNFMSNPSQ